MSKADAMCLRNEPEQTAISVETPGPSLLDYFKTWFIMAIQKDVCYAASGVFVGEFECLRTKPLHTDDSNQGIRHDAADSCVGLDIFELSPGFACGCGHGPQNTRFPAGNHPKLGGICLRNGTITPHGWRFFLEMDPA